MTVNHIKSSVTAGLYDKYIFNIYETNICMKYIFTSMYD